MTTHDITTVIRKDATYVWNAAVALVFVGFLGLAVGATVVDLMAIAD